jgi:hypothetical protein
LHRRRLDCRGQSVDIFGRKVRSPEGRLRTEEADAVDDVMSEAPFDLALGHECEKAFLVDSPISFLLLLGFEHRGGGLDWHVL